MQYSTHNMSRRSFVGLLMLVGQLVGCSKSMEQRTSPSQVPRSFDEILASGVVYIGVCSDNKPFSFMKSSGTYDGIDSYFSLYVADALGVAPKYVSVDPRDAYDTLLSNKVDCCIAQLSPSDSRANEVEFADAIYNLSLGIIARKKDGIKSIEQLEGKELIVCEGSYAEQYARETWPDQPLRTYSTLSSTYKALEGGQARALLADEISAACWAKSKKAYEICLKNVGPARTIAPAVVPGQDVIIKKLRGLMTKTTRKGLYEKYITDVLGDSYFDSMFEEI